MIYRQGEHNMNPNFHTSNIRIAKKMWVACGGSIEHVRGTGEVRYLHPMFITSLRTNDRRNDVPGKLMTRINQATKFSAIETPT